MENQYQKQAMPLIKSLVLLAILATGVSTKVASAADALSPFKAKYVAFRHGKELGEASLVLEDLGRHKYKLSYASKVSLFFLSDQRKETSLFSIQDGKILPYKYNYERTGTGSDKKLSAKFDATQNIININEDKKIPWTGELDNQLYRLDVQLKLMQGKNELHYKLINYRGQQREYALRVLSKEQLELPYGMVEGVKVEISRDNKKRQTYAWFSPQLNYQLVRLQQFKDGEEQGDIRLSSYQSDSVQK